LIRWGFSRRGDCGGFFVSTAEKFLRSGEEIGTVKVDKTVDFIGRKQDVNNLRIKVIMLSSKPARTWIRTVARDGNQIVNGMFSRKNPVFWVLVCFTSCCDCCDCVLIGMAGRRARGNGRGI